MEQKYPVGTAVWYNGDDDECFASKGMTGQVEDPSVSPYGCDEGCMIIRFDQPIFGVENPIQEVKDDAIWATF